MLHGLSVAPSHRRTVTDVHLVHLLRKDLGPGESEAIVLAREIAADFLLMDERLGRSAAQRLGLRCVGLVGFLIEAKRRGLITDAVGTAELLREKAGQDSGFLKNYSIYFGTVEVRRRFQI